MTEADTTIRSINSLIKNRRPCTICVIALKLGPFRPSEEWYEFLFYPAALEKIETGKYVEDNATQAAPVMT